MSRKGPALQLPIVDPKKNAPLGVRRPEGKQGPQRSTNRSEKLKILPSATGEDDEDHNGSARGDKAAGATGDGSSESSDEDDDEDDEEGGRGPRGPRVYKMLSHVPRDTRKDALRFRKSEKKKLPRVTAYCTASSYRMPDLLAWLKKRKDSHGAAPQQYDECIYSPYSFHASPPKRKGPPTGDLLGLREDVTVHENVELTKDGTLGPMSRSAARELANGDSVILPHEYLAEVFFFEYGTVVIWNMAQEDEERFLHELAAFELEKLRPDDVEQEDFHWYLANYSRIYNDVIALKTNNHMTKLSLSHALAQSVKISLFEELIDATIEQTKNIPSDIADSGKIAIKRKDIMRQIGQLFILRINVNLIGSVLDSPEIFWVQPQLEPLYLAARSYLEIGQRVDLLQTKLEVISDLLSLLKEQVQASHGEHLEIIVIVLVALEVVLGILTIVVDLFFA